MTPPNTLIQVPHNSPCVPTVWQPRQETHRATTPLPVQTSPAFTHSCLCVCACVCARFVQCSFVTRVHPSSKHAGQLRRTPRVPCAPFCSLHLSPPLRSRCRSALLLCQLVTSAGLYRWNLAMCDILGQAFFARCHFLSRYPCCLMCLRLSTSV